MTKISTIKCLYSLLRFIVFPILLSLFLLISFFIFTALAWAGGAIASASMKVQSAANKGVSGLRHSKEIASKTYTKTVQRINIRPKLALVTCRGDRIELEAATDKGDFSGEDLDRASFVLREPKSGNQHPISPRLLNLIYRIQVHFKASEIRVVSGYRTPRGGKSEGNHGKGRALDFMVPGVHNGSVAKFARVLGFVGVGIYPTSGFVHVDVRDRSYFWVDMSGPGQRSQEKAILLDVARKNDIAAEKNGERGTEPLVITTDVDYVAGFKK